MVPSRLELYPPDTVHKSIREAISILENPGVCVHNAEVINILAESGAVINADRHIVYIPECLVNSALESVPKEFDLYSLTGEVAVHYGGQHVQFDPGSAAVTLLADETGHQRPPLTDDYVKFVQLVEALPAYDAQSTAMVCRDVPDQISDLYRLFLSLSLMNKPIITGTFRKESFSIMRELLCVASGSQQHLEQSPLAVFDVCPSPPLTWSDLTAQNLIDCTRAGIPVELVSMPLAGATSPVTLAAAVIQHTAESLSGLVIAQCAQSGSKVIWGGAPAIFDMREGSTPMGDAETWLIDNAYIQVGKALGMPTHTYMGSSDAKILDYQSGMESAGGTILAALSGANMISGGGMIDFLRCQSFEKLILDAECIQMARRILAGIKLRDDPIALELIRQSGHTANHLSQQHTLKWFREELYQPSSVIDRSSLESWSQKGRKTSFQRAHDQIEQYLKNPQPSPLTRDQLIELRKITTFAARQAGMDELPFHNVS